MSEIDVSREANLEPDLCFVCTRPATGRAFLALVHSDRGVAFEGPHNGIIRIDYPACDMHQKKPTKFKPRWVFRSEQWDNPE